ncbi:hypothetical protein C6P42_001118 [Pichia californica]|nr:hypothetical protein C6P42_001118 [[Candida] californica]
MRNFSILFGLLLLNIIRVECIIRQNVLEIDDYEDNNGNSNDPFNPPKYRYTDPIMGSKVARMLVSNNTHGMINTKYEINDETITMSLPEYSIDCFNNGDPILLFIKMSHNFKNIEKFNGYDNSITYTVNDESKPEDWPGATKGSMYGLPRVNLRGYFRELIVKEDEEQEHDSRLEARYISKEELHIIEEFSGLVIIGAASLFFKTFPHLNPFTCQSKKTDDESKSITENTEQSTEVTDESTVLVPDYSKFTYEEITTLLKEKNIEFPENASLESLVTLAKTI